MKKFLGLFLFLILVCGLSCGTARAQVNQINEDLYILITEPEETPTNPNPVPSVLAINQAAYGYSLVPNPPSPSTNLEEGTQTWPGLTPNGVTLPQSFKFLEPGGGDVVSDFVIISLNGSDLEVFFQSDGAANFDTNVSNLSNPVPIDEDGTVQHVSTFNITVPDLTGDEAYCDGVSCTFSFGVYVQSDVESPNAVPEPATMLLLGIGLVSAVGVKRTFKK